MQDGPWQSIHLLVAKFVYMTNLPGEVVGSAYYSKCHQMIT